MLHVNGPNDMDQKSGKKQLDDLPVSKSEFWEGEVNSDIKVLSQREIEEKIKREKREHYFIRKKANEAQCTHCQWGFELNSGDIIKDGHLYNTKGKLII